MQKELLPLLDIATGIDDPILRIDDPLRNRRMRHVRAVSQQPEDEEPAQDDQKSGLHPTSRNQQRPALSSHGPLRSTDYEAAIL